MKKIIQKYYLNSKLDIFGLILLLVFTPIISNLLPFFSRRLLDVGIVGKNINVLTITSLLIIILTILKSVLSYLLSRLTNKINLNAVNEFKKEVVCNVINMPLSITNSNSTEYILNRINEVNYLSNILSPELGNFIISAVSAIISLFILMKKSLIIGILSMLLIPFGYILSKISFRKMDKIIFDNMEITASSNTLLLDNLMGIKELKQYNQEQIAIQKINSQLDYLTKTSYMQHLKVNKYINLLSGFFYSFRSIILWIIGYYIMKGYLSIGEYISMGQYLTLVITPVLSAGSIISTLKPAVIALNRIQQDMPVESNKFIGNRDCKEIYEVKVSNLCFGYEEEIQVLKNINFSLNKSDIIHVKGTNGSGKSTLISLLIGYYDNYNGEIAINGIDLKTYNIKKIRKLISILPQNPYLFKGTIQDNIYMGAPEIDSKILKSRLGELIDNGLLTGIKLNKEIIESGKDLSGGEIQRIAIARMYMKDADVYIFDEPNNNLDKNSREFVKKFIFEKLKNKIVILISHDEEFKDIANKFLDM